jgi:hypothetical protein
VLVTADCNDMSVSSVSGGSSSPDAQETERVVLAMKKQQDAQTAQAEGLIQMIEQSNPQVPSSGVGRLINSYA